MKKLLLILLLIACAQLVQAQISQLKTDGNYMVIVSDTVANDSTQYPAVQLRYEILDGYLLKLYWGGNVSVLSTPVDSTTNASGDAFTLPTITTFLRTETGGGN